MARTRLLKQILLDTRRCPAPPARRPEPTQWPADAITGSCLGHSTVLLNFLGLSVITDPIFFARVGPGVGPFVLGPKRYLRAALKPREIPAPDLIVLSHAHFDHFDVRSLKQFSRDTPIVTATATGDLLRRLGFKSIYELAWDQTVSIATRGAPVRITALQVAHWGARMLRDAHRGYNGYLLERGGHAVCFAGDTAYTTAFARLKNPARPIDLMIMPIGAYDPWIRNHCSPEQAAAMANQAGARFFVPIHHETFKLSSEPMDEPAARIRAAFAGEPHRLLAVRVGETFQVPLRDEARPASLSA